VPHDIAAKIPRPNSLGITGIILLLSSVYGAKFLPTTDSHESSHHNCDQGHTVILRETPLISSKMILNRRFVHKSFFAPALGAIMLGVILEAAPNHAVSLLESEAEVAAGGEGHWYWDSVVNLHIDNHSNPVGQGYSAEELAEMIRPIPVELVQVSAYGVPGHVVNYPTERLPNLRNPNLAGFDTLGAWREAAKLSGKRFHVYINTRGLRIHERHPGWMQQDFEGRGKGRGRGFYNACPRPAPNGNGYLERILLPLLEEVSRTYQPGGFWIDGDFARTRLCYCDNCREAWRRQTGAPLPPQDAQDPDWSDWLGLQQDRFDAYRRQMAETIHRENPAAMYTSNHSWRKTYESDFERNDPRDPPAFADSISADLSHGNSLRSTRLAAMLLSADQTTPRDIMHEINNEDRVSLGRLLQQGGLTLSFGGPWFLWVRGSTIVKPEAQARARECAEFARAREEACGRSISRNPYAVLVSETTWLAQRLGQRPDGYHDFMASNDYALALQDAACGVDLVNESLLQQHADSYRFVIVPNQRELASGTVQTLERFVQAGGTVVMTGGSMRPEESEDSAASHLLGLQRIGRYEEESELETGSGPIAVPSSWKVVIESAEVMASFADGRPALTSKGHSHGRVLWLNADGVGSPDLDRLVHWLSRRAGLGPSFRIVEPDEAPHLLLAVRRKSQQTIYNWTDLTSYIAGVRVPPEQSMIIDDPVPVETLQIVLPMAQPPENVRVVPETTSVAHEWKGGLLTLTLRNLQVHAAVLVEGASDEPAQVLGAETDVPQG